MDKPIAERVRETPVTRFFFPSLAGCTQFNAVNRTRDNNSDNPGKKSASTQSPAYTILRFAEERQWAEIRICSGVHFGLLMAGREMKVFSERN